MQGRGDTEFVCVCVPVEGTVEVVVVALENHIREGQCESLQSTGVPISAVVDWWVEDICYVVGHIWSDVGKVLFEEASVLLALNAGWWSEE